MAEQQAQRKIVQPGILVEGTVQFINRYETRNGEMVSADIAVPGCKMMITVPIDKPLPVGSIYSCRVAPTLSNGRLYWNVIQGV